MSFAGPLTTIRSNVMMHLKQAANEVIDQLILILNQIKPEDYKRNIPGLNASIGQHFRHVTEFYICLFEGTESGSLNYDNRNHDQKIETDIEFTLSLLCEIGDKIRQSDSNPDLELVVNYHYELELNNILKTNYARELAYNIEHAIHHMAIIKSALHLFPYIIVPENFGIASSTIRYRNQIFQK
jgi:uncharacterized damage-inducible protein DinB